jgi:hypothetical protein
VILADTPWTQYLAGEVAGKNTNLIGAER